jgi:uncharacterized protein YecE (DUF72 family)
MDRKHSPRGQLATRAGVVAQPCRSRITEAVDALLTEHRIGRVAADPAPVPLAAEPGGDRALRYYRLHASPRMYYSAYAPEYLAALARRLAGGDSEAWCIFDNTAEGAAAVDGLSVIKAISDLVR